MTEPFITFDPTTQGLIDGTLHEYGQTCLDKETALVLIEIQQAEHDDWVHGPELIQGIPAHGTPWGWYGIRP